MSFAKQISFKTALGLIPALVLCVAASPVAAKSPRPFKGRVVATWDNIFAALPPTSLARFNGASRMTHMGNAAQAGTLTLTPTGSPVLFPGNGSVTITAANGDTVTFDYTGILNAGTAEGAGTFNITGGTGRFTGATGAGTFYALIDLSLPANQSMTVILDGKISY